MYNITRLFTKTEYTVAYRFSKDGLFEDTSTPFRTLKLSDPNYWYADPFICKFNDEYYVFMEVFMNDKGYAGIGYSKLINGKLTKPEIVIDSGYHMSFPSIYEYNGKLIMIPETCAKDLIQIFECTDFPKKWEPASIISDNKTFYDSVLFKNDDKYYLFSSQPTDVMYGSKLFLISLNEQNGSFSVSDIKPISEDNKVSREAGKNILHNGKLYRVAQDCSNKDYGHALEFLEIQELGPDKYSEQHIQEITTSDIRTASHVRGIAGVHTYNRENDFEVIDLKLCTFSFKSTIQKIKIIFGMIIDKLKH